MKKTKKSVFYFTYTELIYLFHLKCPWKSSEINHDHGCNWNKWRSSWFTEMWNLGLSALGGEEGVKAVQFILGRWVEAVGMCLREGDNVATQNPRSSAETWRASISLLQSARSKPRTVHSLCCSSRVTASIASLWVTSVTSSWACPNLPIKQHRHIRK